jgi:23S rRNA pseudoU1915 N3-methylase RlmH
LAQQEYAQKLQEEEKKIEIMLEKEKQKFTLSMDQTKLLSKSFADQVALQQALDDEQKKLLHE